MTPPAELSTAPVARLETRWAEAVVFGALWGAMEITLGTFLHMLRVPFAGTFLSAAAAGLLFAGSHLASDRWFPVRAALVAAACRALAPTGLILSPMIAIFMEGVLVALALRIVGRNLAGAMLCGLLATSWSLGHKFVSQLIFYGATIVDLYVQLVSKGAKWLGLESEALGWGIVAALVGTTWLLGILGGLFGHRVARRFDDVDPETLGLGDAEDEPKAASEAVPERAVWPALLVGVAAVACQAGGDLMRSVAGLALIGGFVVVWDRRVLRKVGRLRFWLITLVVALGSGMVLGERSAEAFGLRYSPRGLVAGGLMVTRAAVFVLALGAISARLQRERMLRFFARFGIPGFGRIFAMTAALIPTMITGWKSALAVRTEDGRRAPLVTRTAAMFMGAATLVGQIERSRINGEG